MTVPVSVPVGKSTEAVPVSEEDKYNVHIQLECPGGVVIAKLYPSVEVETSAALELGALVN